MENKINIAELLKDCPSGMELDCTMFDNVTFVRVDNNREQFPVEIVVGGLRSKYLTKEGCFHDTTLLPEAKCVIFPKGKTTWEGFHRPFKDGDIVTYKYENGLVSMILKKFVNFVEIHHHCALYDNAKGFVTNNYIVGEPKYTHLATEEEKQKLFDAIEMNGYKWNEETKTLEKLVEPIFEVGNKIEKCGYRFTIAEVKDDYYLTKCGNKIPIDNQDDFSLVPNKFDITTLKPYDKVLYRMHDKDTWCNSFYCFYKSNHHFVTSLSIVRQCIPYEGNEHLLNTTNDCDDFYKTWEK